MTRLRFAWLSIHTHTAVSHKHTHLMKPPYSRLLTNNKSIKTSFHKGNVMGF